MTINDRIADMLTRIRNAGMARNTETVMPATKVTMAIAEILKQEGYIRDYSIEDRRPQPLMTVHLKYGKDRRHSIRELKRVSKPGLRVYVGKDEVPRVRNGLGTAIISTPQGVLSGKEARRRGIGGELLCTVW